MSMKAFPILLGTLLLATTAACGGEDPPEEDTPSGTLHEVTVRDPHLAFSLDAPGRVMRPTQDFEAGTEDCRFVVYELRDEPNLRVEAPRRTCDLEPQPAPGNGSHGHYVDIEDISSSKHGEPEVVETDLGPAQVLTQTYFECTNSCTNFTEPIAFVTLQDPEDRNFPILVIRSDKEEIGAADFTRIVRSLRAAG